jgi:hypothetical protein
LWFKGEVTVLVDEYIHYRARFAQVNVGVRWWGGRHEGRVTTGYKEPTPSKDPTR